jgi:hypothetical protein
LRRQLGLRCGVASRRRNPESASEQSGSIQGAVLGLLGLLIGFTFAHVGDDKGLDEATKRGWTVVDMKNELVGIN